MGDDLETGPMAQLHEASFRYRVAVGAQLGGKVISLQALPATEDFP